MIYNNFCEKITFFLSLLILNNYFLISLEFPILFLKTNLIFIFSIILIFYFKHFLKNIPFKIFFIIILLISLGTPTLEWDPRSIWLFHAKRIFIENSIFSVKDNYAAFSHNDYPSLVPSLAASVAHLAGHWNEVFPKLAFSLMFLPPIIFINIYIKNYNYLIFLSLIFFFIGKYLFNGWADGLLAVYFTLSVFLMHKLISNNFNLEKKNLFLNLIAILFFVTLTLIKNEGLVLLVIIFLITFVLEFSNKSLKKNFKKIILLSISFIPIILWKYFCYTNSLGNDYINNSFLFNLELRANVLENYKLIFYFLFLNEKFLIALFIFLTSFFILKNNNLFKFVFLIALTYSLILFIVYLSTPYDFYFQLNSSATRTIKSISFLFGFFAIYNLSLKKNNLI